MNNRFLRNLICCMQIVCIVALSFACLCIGGFAEEDVPLAIQLSEEQWAAEADAILQNASSELKEKLAENGQEMPEYVRSLDACEDENKLYVLPDGYVYIYFVRPGDRQIQNELLYATDKNGALYNMGLGYKEDTRYFTTTQEETYDEGWEVTGYIPVTGGNVVRMRNVDFFSGDDECRARLMFFDGDFNYVRCSDYFTNIKEMEEEWVATADKNGQLVEFVVPKAYAKNISYMRISADDFRLDSIVTVNHMIPETEGIGGWFRYETLLNNEAAAADQEIALSEELALLMEETPVG